MWRFWVLRGYVREGLDWLERSISAAGDSPSTVRARAMLGAGSMYEAIGDDEAAELRYLAGLRDWEALDDAMGIALASRHLGNAELGRGRYAQAIEWYAKARRLGEQLNDEAVIAGSVSNLGSVAYFQGDYGRAEEYWTEAAAFFRASSDTNRLASILNNLAELAACAVIRPSPWRGTRRCWSSGSSWAIRSGPPRRSSTSARPSRRRAISPGRGRCWRTGWPACALWGSSATSARACTTWRWWPAPKGGRRRRPNWPARAWRSSTASDELFDLAQCLELFAGVGCRSRASGRRAARLLGAAAALRRTIGARPSAGEPDADAIYATVRGVVGDDGLAAGIAEGETWPLEHAVAEATEIASVVASAPIAGGISQPHRR